ncbi:MAG: glycosyltransferase family 4 protein, partial [Armatimonadetes bacterium]|nr:glycosyltransferase family 4 protein [Armatimonadota bacterium]
RPVVATAVGGTPDVIQDGITGFLLPPHDPEALIRALRQLLASPSLREQFGSAGRRRVEEQFQLDHEVTAWLELLHAAAGRG